MKHLLLIPLFVLLFSCTPSVKAANNNYENSNTIEGAILPPKWTETMTPTSIPSNTPTITIENPTATPENNKINTIIPTIGGTGDNLQEYLDPGRYIAVLTYDGPESHLLEVLSEFGEQKASLSFSFANDINPDQNVVIYYETDSFVMESLNNGNKIKIPNIYNCSGEISWGYKNKLLAVPCGYDLSFLKITDGEKAQSVQHPIDMNPDTISYGSIRWSPDGKWLAYYINSLYKSSGSILGITRLLILNTSCIDKGNPCEAGKMLTTNDDSLISWTPENNLALLNFRNNTINIYNPELNKYIGLDSTSKCNT